MSDHRAHAAIGQARLTFHPRIACSPHRRRNRVSMPACTTLPPPQDAIAGRHRRRADRPRDAGRHHPRRMRGRPCRWRGGRNGSDRPCSRSCASAASSRDTGGRRCSPPMTRRSEMDAAAAWPKRPTNSLARPLGQERPARHLIAAAAQRVALADGMAWPQETALLGVIGDRLGLRAAQDRRDRDRRGRPSEAGVSASRRLRALERAARRDSSLGQVIDNSARAARDCCCSWSGR